MPTLSVTLIGLLVAAVAVTADRGRPGPHVVRALIGAWAGFLVGGLAGVLVDVVVGSGIWLAVVGHATALVGAAVAVRGAALPRSA